ncbi:MAG TPA: hypothetical protein VGC16_07540, partial [Rhizomicrobium sp.]
MCCLRYLPDVAPLLGMKGADDGAVWSAFEALPAVRRDELALDIFYLVLRDAGIRVSGNFNVAALQPPGAGVRLYIEDATHRVAWQQ